MKYKFLLLVAILFIYATSCKDDTIEIEPFDHAAQALKDNDSLVKYMQEHFLNADGELQEIENDEPAIYNDENLVAKSVTYNRGGEDIDYTLYYYIIEQGVNEQPTRVDRANVTYKGVDFDGEIFDRNDYGGWFDLYSGVIPGWSYGLLSFKAGDVIDNLDGTFSYTNTAKGILLIPSGLAYTNTGTGDILPNQPILFYVSLNEVFRVDHDEDNVLSMNEDLETDSDLEVDANGDGDPTNDIGDGDYTNDDTDADGLPNFVDVDDDGDGTLTKDEDTDGDGDPTNDFTNGGIIPDYLNPDIS